MSLAFSLVPFIPLLLLTCFALINFLTGYRQANRQMKRSGCSLNAVMHGFYMCLPTVGMTSVYIFVVPYAKSDYDHFFLLSCIILLCAIISAWLWLRGLPRRIAVMFIERLVRSGLCATAALAIVIAFTVGGMLCIESARFFKIIPPLSFYLGLEWRPQIIGTAANSAFGIIPLLVGTSTIAGIAIFIAGPLGLFSSIYLSHYASRKTRTILKPVLEILAGIPTVVFGFFAIHTVIPCLQGIGELFGIEIAAESALGVGLVMGFMIVPYVAALSEDVLSSTASSLRLAALALGATLSECVKTVILPAAMPGLIVAFLLAISRAIGETMLVVMAAGYSAHLTANPLHAMSTVTVQIVSLLTGDQEFNSPQTLAAFALGLTLFVMTLILNAIALTITRFYQKKYATL